MTKPIKYKKTGLEWCPQIPEHWEVKKLKYVLSINNGLDYKHVQENEGYPVIGSGGQFAYASQFLYDGEALLLGRKGTIDKPLYFVGKFWTVDTMFYGIAKTEVCIKFLYYIALVFPFRYYSTSTTLPSMTQNDFNNHFIPLPSFSEQQRIADYLDRKTSLIDSIISKKEKQIKLYKEERTAIINQAVTKGLNPDVEMKDSGIEWLGSIPKHWEVKKISQGFETIGSGATPSAGNALYYENGTYDWLQTGDLTDNYVTKTSRKITQEALNDYPTLRFYKKGSLVIAMYGATIGKVGILNIETTTNQACCILSDSSTWIIRYVYYWFIANKRHIVALSYGGGQPNISQQTIRNLKIPYLSTKEQELIVTYLDNETNRIDTLVYKTSKQIELLKEYKEALINEVVTGQRIID